jgi:EmrB/QacA subfamily drug resistance transporter
MGQLDASIVNLAYRPIEKDFHASLGATAWVGLAYLLALVGLVMIVGRISDRFGRKLVYLYGFGVFAVGSGLSALAPGIGWLIAFRVVQAVGAAMMQANSVAIVSQVMRRDQLGRGLGIQGAAQALGLALGPLVGGVLVSAGGWRVVFVVNIPLAIVGIVLGTLFIPRSRHFAAPAATDWTAVALLPTAVGSLLAAVSLGHTVGWTSPPIVLLAVLAVGLGGWLFAHERAHRSLMPACDVSSPRSLTFALTGAASSYAMLFGVLFVVPLYLVGGLGTSPLTAGLELTVTAGSLAAVAPLAGRLTDRAGVARRLTTLGMLVASGSGVLLATLGAAGPAWSLWRTVALAGVGVGIGLFTPANNTTLMTSVKPVAAGAAGGLLNLSRGLGTAHGLALTAVVYGSFAATGAAAGPHAAASGFRASLVFLALLGLSAAAVAASAGRESRTGAAGEHPVFA